MQIKVRPATDNDETSFVEFAVLLSRFNRSNHNNECRYDDFSHVERAIRMRAKKTFATRDKDTMICISEVDGDPVGYVLAKIFTQDESADNGTGRMGLLDELYLKESARGMGLGQRMIDETIQWMKEKAVSRVKLHAYSWNDTAKNLYQRNGFKEYAASFEVFI